MILALVAGVGGVIWLSIHFEQQNAVRAAQEQAQSKPEPSKYDTGLPDPVEMWELTNAERYKAGVAPLALDNRLNVSAQEKANDMRDRDYYGHNAPDGTTGPSIVFKHTGKECVYAGENLAKLFGSDTSRKAIDGWMSSTKGHREATIDPRYDSVGFGLAKDRRGLYLVVQHFCDRK